MHEEQEKLPITDMRTMKQVGDGLGPKIKDMLDRELQPLIMDSWAPIVSIFEIGYAPLTNEVVVFIRTTDIKKIVQDISSNPTHQIDLDTYDRPGQITPQTGPPYRQLLDTLSVRYLHTFKWESQSETHLILEFFHVFGSEEDAEKSLNDLKTGFFEKSGENGS